MLAARGSAGLLDFVGIHAAKSAEGPAHMKENLSLYDAAALVAECDVVHYILLLVPRVIVPIA
jgi:hypothetical protein